MGQEAPSNTPPSVNTAPKKSNPLSALKHLALGAFAIGTTTAVVNPPVVSAEMPANTEAAAVRPGDAAIEEAARTAPVISITTQESGMVNLGSPDQVMGTENKAGDDTFSLKETAPAPNASSNLASNPNQPKPS